MVVLCLAAVFAMSATTFVVASPALAACNTECKELKQEAKEKEKAKKEEEKGKYSVNTWGQYKYCPYTNEQATDCFSGITSGGAKGGFFRLGNVTVKLSKPIVLQGGFYPNEQNPICKENPECHEGGLFILPATNGGETLEAPELKVTGGLKVITPQIQTEAGWPQALKESFKEAIVNKEGGVNVKIELAGTGLFEDPNGLSTENLIAEKGAAFKLPLKVRLISSWLTKLGGGPCLVGNDANPIMQNLTSEGSGRSREGAQGLKFNKGFTNIEIKGSTLVDTSWPVEEGSHPSGCGGSEYESFVNDALTKSLELDVPGRTGMTVLSGNLHDASRFTTQQEFEFGHE
jgi:hypothetical protein